MGCLAGVTCTPTSHAGTTVPAPPQAPAQSCLTTALAPLAAAGITFARLFQRCRERFLVSNDMLLRSFLTEFKDHELLHTK